MNSKSQPKPKSKPFIPVPLPNFSEIFDFLPRTARPSIHRFKSVTDMYADEVQFVAVLREHIANIAKHCQQSTPTEYSEHVLNLLGSEGALGHHEARLTYLLHTYADYMPSEDCHYMGTRYSIENCHLWMPSDGGIVIDIVTTATLLHLSPADDHELAMRAFRETKSCFRNTVIGARIIVLDAPEESTFIHRNGASEPLFAPLMPDTFVADNYVAVAGIGGAA